VIDRLLAARIAPVAALIAACSGCTTQLPFGGEPMPANQVATFMKVVTPASEYDQPPKFVHGLAPISPGALLRKGYWGYVELEFTVQTDGSTSDFRMIKATIPDFARAAAVAVQKWQFTPAQKNGHPIAVRVRLPFTFRS
jgi:TonB family protein